MTGIILTGVDDSQSSLKAAEKAASLAARMGADLHVASAYNVNMGETLRTVRSTSQPEAMSSAYHSLIAQYAAHAEKVASDVVDQLRKTYPDLTILAKAVEGSAAVALTNEAEELHADMIVVGNKRVQGPSRVLGSVARAVSHEAKCDVYIVHTH